jgi:c(7)-type cytochrome triheme protein
MPTYSNRRRARRSKPGALLALAFALLCLDAAAAAQIYLPPPPPKDPADYGRVVLDQYSASGPGGVVFDHWLHRSKFTCRLCHVDIGFAMKAKATEIRAEANRQGFYCGACHNGKRQFEGKTIFASCSNEPATAECFRCHSLGKTDVRRYQYAKFIAKLPRDIYGVDWMRAEESGHIHPVDVLEGISIRKKPMQLRPDFSIQAKLDWVHPITFSHERHSVWNGCELCHPEIFPAKREGTRVTMFSNLEHRHCGACHGSVAFPFNHCQGCHPLAPRWAP